jgi:hypothetical protein
MIRAIQNGSKPGRDMAAQRISFRWILKIAIWCLIVGVVLSALGVTPGDFWNSLWRVAQDLYQWGASVFGGLWDYILIGAAVVVPIVVVRFVWQMIKDR